MFRVAPPRHGGHGLPEHPALNTPDRDAPFPRLPPARAWTEAAALSAALYRRCGLPPWTDPADTELDLPLHEALRRVVDRQPDRIAVSDGARAITYRAFWARSEGLAAAIAAARLPPGPIAAILAGDAWFACGLFAALMAGRVCLPVNPANPPVRAASIISAADPAGLLVSAGAADAFGLPGLPRISADAPGPAGAFVPAPPAPDAPAVLVATSGSTGTPKLIVHSQRTLTHRALARIRLARVTPQDRYCFGGGSTSTIADLAHLLSALFSGAAIHLIDPGREGIRGFLARIRQERITILRCGTSLMRTLLVSQDARAALASLRMVRMTGEELLRADVERLRAVLPPDCVITTGYTSTEMAGHFGWIARAEDTTDPVRIPGAHLEAVRDTLILDEAGQVCPPGAVGEIVVRSRFNALGEWAGGRLVPGRLIPDPDDPTRRILFSGDLGYRTTEGVLVVVGRADRQMKINGHRIELAEIETALRALPGVDDAVVLPIRAGETPRLAAFITGTARPAEVAALRLALRSSLPPHMIPSRVTMLPAFPRLPNGKVDTQALLTTAAP